ncbi:trans-Golgi network integral membrane protein TGN38 [Galendromus occidentalis]|uniref:Trans-Golgi network integral membrane protein TGN38 n=1 Tax=Galendromus occidentalis TaxID=34638 RepID=A0AAJ6VX42_9ACAR|nr:trans-Golgi network integral membrane protein TGN38 [Galendromus occidentalis]
MNNPSMMTTPALPIKVSTTLASVVTEAKTSSSPLSVTQSIIQTTKKITAAITEAHAKLEKTPIEPEDTPKAVVIDSRTGQIFRLDPSQPLYEDDSHVFVYFILAMLICAVGYIAFHNKRKILALVIEGRQNHGEVRRSGNVNYKRLNTEPPGVSVA